MKLSKIKMVPFLFGLEPAEMFQSLTGFHLRVIEDAGKEEFFERYLKPIQREMEVTFGERAWQTWVVKK